MPRRVPPALPLALGALVWAGCTALLLVNLLLPVFGHGVMKLVRPLMGVTQPEQVDASWSGLLGGTFQASFARLIGTHMPFYPSAVRLRNQLEFTLAGVSANPGLIVGQERRLFETVYAEEYCSRDLAAWRRTATAWAGQVRLMQDAVEQRGKVFLYVLTPSKVAQYPDILPVGFTCPNSPADRTGTVPAWLAALAAAGVHVVDTTAVIAAAQGQYPFRLYPIGGAHWNGVGAALAQQAVMRALDRLDPQGGFAPFTFTWHMAPHPTGVDVDLANLTNLMRPYPDMPVPVVDLVPAPRPAPCPETRVVIVGGSFSHVTLEYLSKATCNPSPVEYEYWHTFRITWGKTFYDAQPGADPVRRAAELDAAQVVIYEENEQILPDPTHGRAFLAYLQGRRS